MYVVVAAVAANTTFFVLLDELADFDVTVVVYMHLRNGRRVNLNRANILGGMKGCTNSFFWLRNSASRRVVTNRNK